MYKKVELQNGFVGMEKDVAALWKNRNIVKKNFDMNQDEILSLSQTMMTSGM